MWSEPECDVLRTKLIHSHLCPEATLSLFRFTNSQLELKQLFKMMNWLYRRSCRIQWYNCNATCRAKTLHLGTLMFYECWPFMLQFGTLISVVITWPRCALILWSLTWIWRKAVRSFPLNTCKSISSFLTFLMLVLILMESTRRVVSVPVNKGVIMCGHWDSRRIVLLRESFSTLDELLP